MSGVKRLSWLSAIIGGAIILASCGGSSNPSTNSVGKGNLTGAGSTFVEPFYDRAFYAYTQDNPQVTVNYQAIGSGGGIQQITKNTVDFGATDVPMSSTEVTAAGGSDSLVQFPTTLGVVSMAYNLPQIHHLTLDGPAIVGIYLGQIKQWNDPILQSINSEKLPALNIKVVHRSDGSGTSYAFTDYLAKESSTWKSTIGVGKSVSWPVGVGAKGNEGVGSVVKQTEGSIGYVELAEVIQAKLQQAYVKNRAGMFLQATLDGASQAAAGNTSLSPQNFSITDQSGPKAYPIATFSWIVLRSQQKDSNRGKALVDLWRWMVSTGQKYGSDLQYAPLPSSASSYATSQLDKVKT